MGNEEFVKTLLPEILNLDKLFNNLDKRVPGMKGLQTDVVEIYNILKKEKLLKRFPEFVKGGIPSMKKIVAIVASGRAPTDQEFVSLGKSLVKTSGPFIKHGWEALKKLPLSSILDKLEKMDLKSVATKYLDAPLLKNVENAIDWLFKKLRKLNDTIRAAERRMKRRRS